MRYGEEGNAVCGSSCQVSRVLILTSKDTHTGTGPQEIKRVAGEDKDNLLLNNWFEGR